MRYLADIFARIVHFEYYKFTVGQLNVTRFENKLDILNKICRLYFKNQYDFFDWNALRFIERLRHFIL